MGDDFNEGFDDFDTGVDTGIEDTGIEDTGEVFDDFEVEQEIPEDFSTDIPEDFSADLPDDFSDEILAEIPDDTLHQGYIDSPVTGEGIVDPVAVSGYEQAEEVSEEIDSGGQELNEIPFEVSEPEERPELDAMSQYMSEHNYGLEDAAEYQNDPEWQALNRNLQEEDGIERDPHQDMQEYMSNHNYGLGDTPEFHADPEWQEINNRVLESEGAKPVNYEEMIPSEEDIDLSEEIPDDYETTEEVSDIELGGEIPEDYASQIPEDTEMILEEPEVMPESPEEVPEEPETMMESPEEIPKEPEEMLESPEEVPEGPEEMPESPEEVPEEPEETPESPEEVPEELEVMPESPEEIPAPEEPEVMPESPEEFPAPEEPGVMPESPEEFPAPEEPEEMPESPEEVLEEPEVMPESPEEFPVPEEPEVVTEDTEPGAPVENIEETSDHPALDAMSQYMSDHNYGIEDAEEYRNDPEWQELNRELLIESGMDPADFGGETLQEIPDAVEKVDGVAQELEMGDYEQMVTLDDPDFYKSGEFLDQGLNEYGFNGTCGETTQANTLNRLFETNRFTENNVLDVAVNNGLCEVSVDPDANGGTNTEQFLQLYEKMNEQLGGNKLDVQCFEYENALSPEVVAAQLEDGKMINVAVDANRLWDYPQDYVDEFGNPVNEIYSDHWISVTGVNRDAAGNIESFNILDSGGGETNVSLQKYEEMCFGSEHHDVIDPTTIVVSRKDTQNV